MGISQKLVDMNYERFQGFQAQKETEAGYAFDGPSFKCLNINDFNKQELDSLQRQLCILSGLYGYLRPLDLMRPYRLEMGTKLDVDGCSNLYEFWAKHNLAQHIATIAKKENIKIILNCASQEYSKAVDFDVLRENGLQVVNCVFKSASGRMASVYAKQARGMMVRFVAKNEPSSLEELESFMGTTGHFKYVSTDETSIVFERQSNPVSGGDDVSRQKSGPKLKRSSSPGRGVKDASRKRTRKGESPTDGEA
mmetsp:Transcript_39592/g.64203  ORF Transcript_39592/g.64203 Transcript_39592/m.64203 type:complete len:252 (+) Transcript_39592:2687-3442(+)